MVVVVAGVPFELVRLGGRGADEVVLGSDVGDLRIEANNLPDAVALDAALVDHAAIGVVFGGHFECAVRSEAVDGQVGTDVGALRVSSEVTGVRCGGDGKEIAGFDVHAAGDAAEVGRFERHTGIARGTQTAIAFDVHVDGLSADEHGGDRTLQSAIVFGHGNEGFGRRLEDCHVTVVVKVDARVAIRQPARREPVLTGGIDLEHIPAALERGGQELHTVFGRNHQGQGIITAAARWASSQGQLGRIEVFAIPKDRSVIPDLIGPTNGEAVGAGVM